MRIAAVSCLSLLITTSAALAQTASPSISVRGTCAVTILPDRARFSATATDDAPDPAHASAKAVNAARRYRADIEKLALADAQITATGVSIQALTEDFNGKSRPAGFRAQANVSIETSDAPRLGEAMVLAAQDGMGITSDVDSFLAPATREKIISDCLPKASADAKNRAQSLLAGIGAGVGAVLRVDGYDVNGETPPPGPRPMMMRFNAGATPPEVSLGTITLTVSTSVTFAIAPGK